MLVQFEGSRRITVAADFSRSIRLRNQLWGDRNEYKLVAAVGVLVFDRQLSPSISSDPLFAGSDKTG
jgi:hypothetical protein